MNIINGIEITKPIAAARYALGIMGTDKSRIRLDIAYQQWFLRLMAEYHTKDK